MKNYKLHLIRHGLTEGNIKGVYLGAGVDSPVCEEGVRRLNRLLEDFSYPQVEKIYSSPMLRARETTELLYKDKEYQIVADLMECKFGEFEGKTIKELMETNENYAKWLDINSGYVPEGGESSMEFANRCISALNEILEDMMKNGIFEASAICHGGVISIMLAMVGYPKKMPNEWMSDNGCGYTIQTTTANWTRDNLVEVTGILPIGYDNSEAGTNKFK